MRRLPARTADGVRVHLIDLQVVDPRPRDRLRVAGLIVRRRRRLAWPVSLRPRQSAAGADWRFVASAEVQVTPTGLVIERHLRRAARDARDQRIASPETTTAERLVRTPRIACAAVLCVMVCSLAAACRAPGEPPAHPGIGAYRDIIRREADSTHTALATTRLLVLTARTQGVPRTYARVTLRQVVEDLQHVVIDLGKITPPRARGRATGPARNDRQRDAALLERLQHDWSDRALRILVLHVVARHADELDGTLDQELQG